MNSLNLVQAHQTLGTLGFTTWEFLRIEHFLPRVVGKALFLLHDAYILGTSTILIPVPGYKDTRIEPCGAFTATLFGGPFNASIEFNMAIETVAKVRKNLTVCGGDMYPFMYRYR